MNSPTKQQLYIWHKTEANQRHLRGLVAKLMSLDIDDLHWVLNEVQNESC